MRISSSAAKGAEFRTASSREVQRWLISATLRHQRKSRQFYFISRTFREEAIMHVTKLAVLILTIAVALFILIPSLSWAADDGATL